MKVNDYVRIKGIIKKIDTIGYQDDTYISFTEDNTTLVDKSIIKSSPNILELLEEHDFITIEYYSLRYDERVERIFEVDYKDNEFTTLKNAYCDFMLKNNEFNDNDKALEPIIKSIVTKEHFSQMEYRVGSDKE